MTAEEQARRWDRLIGGPAPVYVMLEEAIALLREGEQFDLEHPITCTTHAPRPTGLEEWKCDCGVWEYVRKTSRWLRGEGDAPGA